MKKIGIILLFIVPLFIITFTIIYFTNNKYVLSYENNLDSTSQVIIQKFHKNDNIVLMNNPYSMEGYRFDGWTDNSNLFKEGEEITMPGNNYTLYAKWIKLINISFIDETLTPIVVDEGSTITFNQLPVVTKDDFIFTGWYLDEQLSTKLEYNKYQFTTDTILYPKFDKEAYILTYDNSLTTDKFSEYCGVNETIVLIDNPFSMDGYRFEGWTDNNNNTFEVGDEITMPSNDYTLYAKWAKQVAISFDNDSQTLLSIDEGSTVSFNQLPIITNDELVFAGWYLDENLTKPLEYGEYQFTTDTKLYPKFVESETTTMNFYKQKETIIDNTASDISFVVQSSIELTNTNLYNYVTLEREVNRLDQNDIERYVLPILNVEKKDDKYLITPDSNYTPGGVYVISVKEPLYIEVSIDSNISLLSKVVFIIKNEYKSTIEYRKGIITVTDNDFLFYDGTIINLKEEFVLDNDLTNGSIIKVIDVNEEFYKVGNMIYKTLNEVSYFEITLLACDLGEVYQNFDIYSGTMEDCVVTPSDALSSEENFIKEIESNQDFIKLRDYLVAAVREYGNRNNINKYKDKEPENNYSFTIETSKTNEKPGTYADVYNLIVNLECTVTIELDTNINATINIKIRQEVNCSSTSQGWLYTEGFFLWNLDVTYDFYLLTILRSQTDFEVEISINDNGKKSSITNDLQNIIDTSDPNSVVGKYREFFNIKSSELNILSLPLFRFAFTIEIFEFGIPIELRVKVDVNAIFKGKITAIIEKGYSISGTHQKGLEYGEHDRQQHYSLEFASIGNTGMKIGLSFGIEISFANLSDLGRIGIEVEVGAYFNYYGYGKHKIVEVKIFGLDMGTIHTGKANFYYEFGIYLSINAYVRSDWFNFDYTKNLLYTEFPLFDGGNKNVILGYASQEPTTIVTNTREIDLNDFSGFNLLVLDLTTGKTFTQKMDFSRIYISGYHGGFDTDTGIFDILGERSETNRYDITFTTTYNGKHGNWNQYFLYKDLVITFLPFNIDSSQADKMLEVKFIIEDEVIYNTQLLIGKTLSKNDRRALTKKIFEYDPLITYVDWGSDFNNMYRQLFENTSFVATDIQYYQGLAYFKYLVRNNEKEYWYTESVQANVGTYAGDLVSELKEFPGSIDENYYRFVGWNKEFENLPKRSYYVGGKDLFYVAIYEKIPFQVTLSFAPIYDVNGKMIRNSEFKYIDVIYGDTISVDDYTIPGYNIQALTDQNINIEDIIITKPLTVNCNYILKNDFMVTVYDSSSINANIIKQFGPYAYGSDITNEIFTDETITTFIEQFEANADYTEGKLNIHKEIIGWTDNTSYISMDTAVYPLFNTTYSFNTVNIKFDGGIGKINQLYEYQATQIGFEVETMNDASEFAQLCIPSCNNTNEYEYVFNGWYDNQGLTGTKVTNFIATENITYYAKFDQIQRKYTLKVQANGFLNKLGEINTITISGLFVDENEIVYSDLTYGELTELINDYFNNSESNKPTPLDSDYEFSYWESEEIDSVITLYPYYIRTANIVNVIFNIGDASFNGHTGVIVDENQLLDGTKTTLNVDNFFTPLEKSTYDYYNGEIKQFNYAYEDNNYYYIPVQPICWSFDKVNPIPSGTSFELTNTSDDLVMYALYNKIAKNKTAKFIISSEKYVIEGVNTRYERFDDLEGGYERIINGQYGETLSEDQIPKVTRAFTQNSVYNYELDYWLCVETNTRGVNNFDDNYTYTPVFKKVINYITITFDATEYGVFPATNSRYHVITVPTGSSLDIYNLEKELMYGDNPIYTSSENMEYFNWYFDQWDTYQMYFYQDMTITAIYKSTRNQIILPTVGITVTNGLISEDVGVNRIPGYIYDPQDIDNEYDDILIINSPGLIFSSTSDKEYYIQIYLNTYDVTFKDITFKNQNEIIKTLYYFYNEDNLPNISPIINIDGHVTLKTFGSVILGETGLVIKGTNSNSVLDVYSSPTDDTNIFYLNLSPDSEGNNSIENINVNIKIEAEAETEVVVFYVNIGDFTIINSQINIDVTSSKITNKYVIMITDDFTSANDEQLKESIIYTGCNWTNE